MSRTGGVRRHARRSGVVNAVVMVVLLLVVATVALTTTPTPPPAIAEFAPQPLKQNKQVQKELSTEVGRGGGGGGGGGAGGTGPGGAGGGSPSPSAPPSSVPTVTVPASTNTLCVGDPPRQIEDPQSPPCVAPWQGDNGGATATGVTRDTIKVFLVRYGGDQVFQPYADFFNARFQLYGRKIVFVPSDVAGGGNQGGQENSEKGMRALGAYAAQSKVFASTYWIDNGGYYYTDELARRRIISIVNPETAISRSDFARWAPYAWGYTMDSENLLDETGTWICKRFAGKPVSHGSPIDNGKPRKFGIILRPAWDDNRISTARLDARLGACGVKPVYQRYPPKASTQDYDATLQRLSDAGVTTVMCLCWYVDGNNYMVNAASLGYQPEWLQTSFGEYDNPWNFRFVYAQPASESSHEMGLSFMPRVNKVVNEPFWWALKAINPSTTPPSDVLGIWHSIFYYREMLELAAGFQMAGPNLTPERFRTGMQGARFPNPDTPLKAGKVGFGGGSYTMTLDAAEWWYDPSAPSPYPGDAAGAMCYVDGARRRGPNDWADATGDPFYKGRCDSAG